MPDGRALLRARQFFEPCQQSEDGVALVHYDRDYERIAAVSDLRHQWLVPNGALARST